MFLKRRFKRPNSLAFRLTFWYASAFIAFSLLAFLILYISINSILFHEVDEDLIEDVLEFKYLYESDGLPQIEKEIIREIMSDDPSDIFIRLLDKQGKQLFSSDLTDWPELLLESSLKQIPTELEPVLESKHFSKQEYETRMVYGLLDQNIIIHIGETLEPKEEILELLLIVSLILFSILIPIASIISWIIAKQAVVGIEEVSRAAHDVEQGEYDRHVSVKTKDKEIQQLVDSFNSMAGRIRILIAEMREMTDNIAHDLRSPLARIRLISETVLSGASHQNDCSKAASDTLEECDRLLQLINTTLDVAEVEAGVSSNSHEKVNLEDLTKDACELFEPVAEQKNISLTDRIESVPLIHGNRYNLQRMIANLLDNAIKYTPEKGTVNIQLSVEKQKAKIIITDSGIGIPLSDQLRIFDRFFRCDQSRTEDGCGLGLSFARAVAHNHAGEIRVESSLGESSTFTIILPVIGIKA